MPEITTELIDGIYRHTFDSIYRFFIKRVLSRNIAEELTSSTYLRWLELIHKRNNIADPKRFLYGVAKNTLFDYIRSKYKAMPTYDHLPEEFMEYVQDEDSESPEKMTLEERATPFIKQLPAKQCQVLEMRLLQKMTLKEIATTLGKNLNYVTVTQRRGLRSLEKLIVLDGFSEKTKKEKSCTASNTNNITN